MRVEIVGEAVAGIRRQWSVGKYWEERGRWSQSVSIKDHGEGQRTKSEGAGGDRQGWLMTA